VLTALLCDRASDTELLDLSAYATKKISPRLSRPITTGATLAGDTPGLWDTGFDGRPNLEVGTRTLKILQDGVLRANTPIWNISGTADETTSSIDVTGIDALIYTLTRLAQIVNGDGTQNFSDMKFPSPISGAELLETCLLATIANDGPLPIDLTGPIASSTDLAVDMTNWPVTIADLITTLTASGGLEILLNPADTHTGYAPGVLGSLTAADHLGQDLTGSVHFVFEQGNEQNSIAKLRRSFDMSSLANKLWYYLGGAYPLDSSHYAGNITGTETGAAPGSEDLTAYQALQLASQDLYLVAMVAKIIDDNNDENSERKLWHRIWKTEVALRTVPRELLFITPVRGEAAPYRPFIDYTVGDTVSSAASALVGPAFTDGVQRVYGFDLSEDVDGVETVGELIVSADGIGTIG
jgi:hypothetical protein